MHSNNFIITQCEKFSPSFFDGFSLTLSYGPQYFMPLVNFRGFLYRAISYTSVRFVKFFTYSPKCCKDSAINRIALRRGP
jgi:hypothetical protein